MLRALLALMVSGGGHTTESVARSLGVGCAEIAPMLARLRSLGYIEERSESGIVCRATSGGKACAACSACFRGGAFAGSTRGRVWTLTMKGSESLGKPRA